MILAETCKTSFERFCEKDLKDFNFTNPGYSLSKSSGSEET